MTKYWIAADHPVFDSPAFLEDIILFDVLDRAIRPSAFLRLSDAEHFIIARNRADLAAWVWTSNTIPEDKLMEVMALLQVHFAGRRVHATAKTAVAERIQEYYEALGYHLARFMGLKAYRLDRLHMLTTAGQPRLARMEDADTLCKYQRSFHQDCFDRPLADDPLAGIVAGIQDGVLSVLEVDGAIASFVRATPNPVRDAIVVNQVYTHPEHRGHGYAKYLLGTAIQPALAQGMHAVLYADSKNPFSNAAYWHVGFVLQGEVLEIEMTQEERTV